MANKKSSAPSPIQQIISFAAPKKDKSILSLQISDTENYDIEVKAMLGADEMASFVESVTNALFLNDQYTPALYELIFAKAVIAYYTNLKVSISNDELVILAFSTNIIEKIEDVINQVQLDYLIEAIHKNIDFKQQDILNSKSVRLEEAIRQIEALTGVTSKIADQFNEIDMKQMAESSIKLANIPERDLISNIIDINFSKNSASEGANESNNKTPYNGGEKNV